MDALKEVGTMDSLRQLISTHTESMAWDTFRPLGILELAYLMLVIGSSWQPLCPNVLCY